MNYKSLEVFKYFESIFKSKLVFENYTLDQKSLKIEVFFVVLIQHL